jgi:peroxiredoxin
LAEYRYRFDELTSLGFGLVAVSVDSPQVSRGLAQQLRLPFPLLSDTAREVVRAYGLFNEREKGGIAYPATLVLDRSRTVRFRSLDRTASRVSLDALLAFLRAGVESPAPAKPERRGVVPRIGDFVRVTANALRHGTRSPWSR